MKRICCLALLLALLAVGIAPACAERALRARQSLEGCDEAALANVTLAVEAVDGYYLPRGSRFSFNEATGPRTPEYGYAPAADSEPSRGVELVATVLYRALSAGGARVEYDSLSFSPDGAVRVDDAEGLDFSFFNYDADFCLELYVDGGALNCSVSFAAAEDSWNAGSRLVGSATLRLAGPEALRDNAALACGSINDTTLGPGDLFSFNEVVGPCTREYGYQSAPNGAGEEAVGGGVDAVASALSLAVKDLDGVTIGEKSFYGGRYSQNYVASPQDALLVDYRTGAHFSFTYTGRNTLAIYLNLDGEKLTCEVYETASW